MLGEGVEVWRWGDGEVLREGVEAGRWKGGGRDVRALYWKVKFTQSLP